MSSFGAALAAIVARRRFPSHHLEGDSKDVLRLVLGFITTLTAMVLSLLISSGYSAYQSQKAELQQLGVHIDQIDRALADFGPDTIGLRDRFREMIAVTIRRVWPADGDGPSVSAPVSSVQHDGEALFSDIANLVPKTDLQRRVQNRALELLERFGETRRLLIAQSQGTLSWPLLFLLMSWLTLLFFGFGLLTHYNATVAAALFVGSFSVAGAIFLIVELNQPYGGWMQISSAPLRAALAEMGG
jgi:Protein of unknown function (DUF4239)